MSGMLSSKAALPARGATCRQDHLRSLGLVQVLRNAVLLDVLNRYRGKEGQQKVTVEHVDVHAGGQAVVGMVESPRGGDQPESEDQPRAKQITHAPQPAVWSADKA